MRSDNQRERIDAAVACVEHCKIETFQLLNFRLKAISSEPTLIPSDVIRRCSNAWRMIRTLLRPIILCDYQNGDSSP